MTDLQLMVDGEMFGGWKRVDVERSIEQMAGAFDLEVTLKWDGQAQPYKLREGLPCQVLAGRDVLITGYIDDYSVRGTSDNTVVRVAGRCKTADLVDCSAIHKTGQWRNVGLQQIVQDIAQPFGIGVTVDAAADLGERFKTFALQEGERAFEAIDRACRMRAVLCTSTPQGNVLLTQASDVSTAVELVEGENIESFDATHTWRERYSTVTLKGQTAGDDDESGAAVAHVKAEAKDEEIDRYRPLVVVSEHGAGLKVLQDRAAWEVKVRMGRGKRGSVGVTGWRIGRDGQDGALWEPNRLVYIDSPSMGLAAEMLIVQCRYSLTDQEGQQTTLTFARREAFEVAAGVRRSRLSGRLNHLTQREKKKKAEGYPTSWDLSPPVKGGQ